MKKSLVSILSILVFYITYAQVRIGYNENNAEGELLQTDPLAGQQYYKSYSFKMKKGDGVVFTMNSEAFEPHIILATDNSDIIAEAKVRGKSSEAKLVFIAPADTSFNVVFTSVKDKKTGKFNINFKMLEASQMIFNDNFSICDRLAFLINHWQLEWELMPGKTSNTSDELYLKWWPNLYFNTTNTLQKGGKTEVRTYYTELLFTKENDQGNEAEKFYEQLGKTLAACLDKTEWRMEKEPAETYFLKPDIENAHTYFIMKGGEKGQNQKSIDIMLTTPKEKKLGNYSTVKLFFE